MKRLTKNTTRWWWVRTRGARCARARRCKGTIARVPMTLGKTSFGASSPAQPAFMEPVPLSITRAVSYEMSDDEALMVLELSARSRQRVDCLGSRF